MKRLMRLPTTFGNPSQFAINLDLNECFCGEWLFGRIDYVVNSHHIGDYDLGTSLRDVHNQMHHIISDAGKRSNSRFVGMKTEELFDFVWQVLYGGESSGTDEIAIDECWAKHNITIPVDVFDGIRLFQFDEFNYTRLLWRSSENSGSTPTYEYRTPLGTTEQCFFELNHTLDEMRRWRELNGDTAMWQKFK